MDCDEVLAPVETLSERVSDEDNAEEFRFNEVSYCMRRILTHTLFFRHLCIIRIRDRSYCDIL